eukprot:CAMPEP_0179281546 /NCGR_PEP_ID=MMETSP0797-20121207/37210_1 /TAXON_ID=47934 /ORGANISM="Dinophysis acuminata, Strain DAEP01" /LENGTH=170 /DNA_ID=CAMNT_0020990259 /DNA_START=100 /DNA_END=608 /DNA_ORIENTATION=+
MLRAASPVRMARWQGALEHATPRGPRTSRHELKQSAESSAGAASPVDDHAEAPPGLLEQVEHHEGQDRGEVDAGDGREDAAEQVQVRVADVEERPEDGDALRRGEPGEQDADGDEVAVEAEEIQAALHEGIADNEGGRARHHRSGGRQRADQHDGGGERRGRAPQALAGR